MRYLGCRFLFFFFFFNRQVLGVRIWKMKGFGCRRERKMENGEKKIVSCEIQIAVSGVYRVQVSSAHTMASADQA